MKPSSVHEFLDLLAQVRDMEGQRAFISESDFLPSDELVIALASRIREFLPKDPELAEVLTESILLLASEVDTALAWGLANQCKAHAFMNVKKAIEAKPLYQKAREFFVQAGAHRELGRSLCAESYNLTYLSEYERALELAQWAQQLLEEAGDTEYLPRFHVARANAFIRLHRFPEALEQYDQALERLADGDDYFSTASVELNRASVLTELNRFDDSLRSYETARDHCEKHGIVLWSDLLDRNIAELYFKRGSYSEALRSLEKVRPTYLEQGDDRRLARCDLARAEIYLQLNLPQEAAELAENSLKVFEEQSNRLEAGQCLTHIAIAQSDRGETQLAEETFRRARELFSDEGNAVSVAAVDLQLARLLKRRRRFADAEDLALAAAEAFEEQELGVRGAYARIVLAQCLRDEGRAVEAIGQTERALAGLEGYHAKWVSYQCYDLMGSLQASEGALEEAERLYMKAIEEMESLRGNIGLDEFRMSFGRDKYQVYENVVDLKIRADLGTEAFDFVERSKSRTLIDLLEQNLDSVWQSNGSGSSFADIQKARQDLNGLYSRLSQAGTTISSLASDKSLQTEIDEREKELVALLRAAGSQKDGWVALETMALPSLREIQGMLEDHEVLIEYYTIKDRFCAFVISGSQFHLERDLGTIDAVRSCLKGLNFQLSKFHLSAEYLKQHQGTLLKATTHHLGELYRLLMAPLEDKIKGHSLVIIPHHVLHYVPFQALFDGEAFVVDRHDVVYSASASVLKICREKELPEMERDLVLAVADESTPAILEEADVLRELLPDARVFVGAEATADLLRKYGPTAGKLHIAAHGVFRSDNPMFSSILLGDSWLNLVDIFNLKLGAELTTLSACETGMSALYEGDELLGLTRGFLYAGTPSLVVSLWRVNDRSTTQLMRRFYEGLAEGLTKPKALQQAALSVKESFPHPYFWAPFVLMGKS